MRTAINPMGDIDMAKDYIIDYGNNENKTQWYRLWKSGWIEQGGSIPSMITNTYTGATVNLIKPYTNNNYTVTMARNNNGQMLGNDLSGEQFVFKKSITQIVFGNFTWTYGCDWYACGY